MGAGFVIVLGMDGFSQRIRRMTGSDEDLRVLAEALRAGNLVAIPTETVYGLAANALDAAACRRIFEVKGRPLIDPLIVHVTGIGHAESLAEVNPDARALMERYWPGPITFVLKRKSVVPDIVSAGLPTVALRCPNHPLTQKLLRFCGLPLVGPSANRFGYVSPTCAEHVENGLGDRIDYVLDGGPCNVGLESTIVGMADPEHPVYFRPGAISREELSKVLGREVALPKKRVDSGPMDAPGMLSRHYSPRTPLTLFNTDRVPERSMTSGAKEAAILFQHPADGVPSWTKGADVFWFSESGQPTEAARNVFALLRKLDESGYSRIYAERSPSGGIGDAINDRLGRAAATSRR
jgi:L-threonylcarbamoyladenylate synthase